jgi:hypothetical protein
MSVLCGETYYKRRTWRQGLVVWRKARGEVFPFKWRDVEEESVKCTPRLIRTEGAYRSSTRKKILMSASAAHNPLSKFVIMQMCWRQKRLPNTYNQMFSSYMKRMVTSNYKATELFVVFHNFRNTTQTAILLALRHEAWTSLTANIFVKQYVKSAPPFSYLLTYSMEQSPSWEDNWFCS